MGCIGAVVEETGVVAEIVVVLTAGEIDEDFGRCFGGESAVLTSFPVLGSTPSYHECNSIPIIGIAFLLGPGGTIGVACCKLPPVEKLGGTKGWFGTVKSNK